MKKNQINYKDQNKSQMKKNKNIRKKEFDFNKSIHRKDKNFSDKKEIFNSKERKELNRPKHFYKNSEHNFKTSEKSYKKNFIKREPVEHSCDDFICGKKIVLESLESSAGINKLYIAKNNKGLTINKIISLCKEKSIIFSFLDKKILDKKFGDNTQGIVALTSPREYINLDEFLKRIDVTKKNFIVILDNITDPHNVGAIIRSAFIFGFSAIILPSRNACLINSTVLKASSGAVNKLDIIKIMNLNKTIEILKENKFLILVSDVTKNFSKKFPLDSLKDIEDNNICVVLGSEGSGVRETIKKASDYCINIPMKNNFNSLNVSCAASIIFYELSKNL